MQDAAEEPRRRAAGRPFLPGRWAGLGVWGVACLAYWAVYVVAILLTSKLSLGVAARSAFVGVLPDCLLVPFALFHARRAPWGAVSPRRFLVWHAVGVGLFVLLSTSGTLGLYAAEQRLTTGRWPEVSLLQAFAWKGLGSLLVYVAACGLGNALEQARRAARAETLRAEAQLAALRARLNPHFIFNLLHTLMGLVARDPDTAQAALEQLGDVLRYALRVQAQGLDEVRLREEWDFVDRYLALERLRLGSRLRASLEAEEGLLDAAVPAFSLQPLVENAVRHAIATRASGGEIRVTARRDGTALLLAVDDDGSSVRAGGAGAPSDREPDSGIGLRLIRERLLALYGEAARLETGRSELGGWRAAVSLPLSPRAESSA